MLTDEDVLLLLEPPFEEILWFFFPFREAHSHRMRNEREKATTLLFLTCLFKDHLVSLLRKNTQQWGGKEMFVQIVTSKLKEHTSRDHFLRLTAQMYSWLREQPGFVGYELYEGADAWTDRLVWDNQECATKGEQNFLATDIAKQFLELVEPDYQSFFGQAIFPPFLLSSSPEPGAH